MSLGRNLGRNMFHRFPYISFKPVHNLSPTKTKQSKSRSFLRSTQRTSPRFESTGCADGRTGGVSRRRILGYTTNDYMDLDLAVEPGKNDEKLQTASLSKGKLTMDLP